MEWVKDPKNQPIVAAIAIVVIIGVGIFYYFSFIKPPAPAPAATETAPAPGAEVAPASAPGAAPPPAPGMDPAATAGTPDPSAGTAPAASAPAASTSAQVASVTPMETWRSDPFMPIGHKAKKAVRVTPPIRDFPFVTLPGVRGRKQVEQESPEIQQPPRRMAGILLNDRVYAIIESNGGSEVVQPGDYLKDRLAMVQKIEPDRVVLKTVDKKPRYITVKMARSAREETPTTPGPSSVGGPRVPMPMPMGPPPPGPGLGGGAAP